MSRSFPRVVADIGGTNVRFALGGDAVPGGLHHVREMPHEGLATIYDAVEAYAGETGLERWPDIFVFAVAGPVSAGRAALTNAHWTFDEAGLQERYGLRKARLINDFEALAWTLPHLSAQDLTPIGPALSLHDTPEQTLLILGPGTGLGMSVLRIVEGRMFVLPTEGGHVGFAPLRESDHDLLTALQASGIRATNETVLCGAGLLRLYEFWSNRLGVARGATTPVEVSALAAGGQSEAAQNAVADFMRLLGSVAGDMALAYGAHRVFLAGGILPQLTEALKNGAFRSAFEDKPPYRAQLAGVPTLLVHHPYPALIGCAHLAL